MIFVVVTAEILVTYSRLPARELYHVSGSGIEGGLSRAVLFTNFPVALVALAVLALVYERLPARGYRIAAIVSCALCAVILWPGVVNESDLDARPVNAFAAVGVLLAILLTDVVARAGGLTQRPWRRPDWFRVAIAAGLLFAALPWLAADLGFYLNGVPLLGRIFQSGEFLPERPGLPTFAPGGAPRSPPRDGRGPARARRALAVAPGRRRQTLRAASRTGCLPGPHVLLRDRELRERHLDRAGRQAGVDELGDPERRASRA